MCTDNGAGFVMFVDGCGCGYFNHMVAMMVGLVMAATIVIIVITMILIIIMLIMMLSVMMI